MTAAGFAWFAGDVTTYALYLHRGPLVALVLTYPTGRASRRIEQGAIVLAAAVAVVAPVARSAPATVILAAFVIAVAGAGYARTRGRARRARLAALCATGYLARSSRRSQVRAASPPSERDLDATLLVYEAGLCALAIGLLAGLVHEPHERAAWASCWQSCPRHGRRRCATRSHAHSATRRSRSATGCPSYRHTSIRSGGSSSSHRRDGARAVTPIERNGHAVAVLVHDPMVLDDPGLEDAIASVTRLTAANARLQAEVQGRLVELEASRLRLLRSEDAERRRLEARLRDGAERRLVGNPAHARLGARACRCRLRDGAPHRSGGDAARTDHRGAARARPRPPSARRDRGRPRRSAHVARRAEPGPGRPLAVGRPPARGARGRGLLRLLGGTCERRQARISVARIGARRRRAPARSRSR